jgi:hypothetical protein
MTSTLADLSGVAAVHARLDYHGPHTYVSGCESTPRPRRKRRQSALAYEFGVSDLQGSESVRPEFRGEWIVDPLRVKTEVKVECVQPGREDTVVLTKAPHHFSKGTIVNMTAVPGFGPSSPHYSDKGFAVTAVKDPTTFAIKCAFQPHAHAYAHADAHADAPFCPKDAKVTVQSFKVNYDSAKTQKYI